MQIKRIDTPNPVYEEFALKLADGELTREEIVREAHRLTGVVIHDVGNTTQKEFDCAIRGLCGLRLNNKAHREGTLPTDIHHLVIGHAGGLGDNWFFFRNNGRVKDYVNDHVPKGERCWVVACEAGIEKSISKLEGKEIVSTGPQTSRGKF